jgi:hypothetical protein
LRVVVFLVVVVFQRAGLAASGTQGLLLLGSGGVARLLLLL